MGKVEGELNLVVIQPLGLRVDDSLLLRQVTLNFELKSGLHLLRLHDAVHLLNSSLQENIVHDKLFFSLL